MTPVDLFAQVGGTGGPAITHKSPKHANAWRLPSMEQWNNSGNTDLRRIFGNRRPKVGDSMYRSGCLIADHAAFPGGDRRARAAAASR
jgi:hypothetical protein